MKVLFCTDGSEISMNSFSNLTQFIKNDAVIDVICVIDWSFLPTSMNIDSEGYTKAYENIAESVLNFAENMIKEKGFVMGEKIKSLGSAAEGILERIADVEYDLIVLGSHGKKGLQKWLGSVSRQVLSNTTVPVFVSKKKDGFKKIIMTVDGSEQSFNSIKTAINLLNFTDKEIHIISIKENPELLPIEATLDKNWLDNIEKQQKIHATKAINKAKAILEGAGIKTHNEVILTGNPAQKILEYIDREKANLVIMGARTKTDLSKLLLGSVSKRVLENTNIDVLIISK